MSEGSPAVSKSDPRTAGKEKNKAIRWFITIFFVTIAVSGTISFLSDEIMSRSGIAVACVILLLIILVGIVFDVLGVAVTSADEAPFHSMAARKVPGSQEAIRLLRSAERVSSICNDVIGDICGVVSGSASATIAAQVLARGEFRWPQLLSLLMSALVAGLTVGGKAIGKTVAIGSCTQIVHTAGKLLYWLRKRPKLPGKKKTKR